MGDFQLTHSYRYNRSAYRTVTEEARLSQRKRAMLPKRVDEARWPWSVRFDDAYTPLSVRAITETQVIFADIVPMIQIPVLHTYTGIHVDI